MASRLIGLMIAVAFVAGCDKQAVVPPASVLGEPSPPAVKAAEQTPAREPLPASPSPETPADASATPAQVAMSIDEAAAAYLAIAKEYNKKVRAAYRKYNNATTLAERRKEWLTYAKADMRFADRLKALVWPDEVAGEATRLVRLSVIAERDDRACVRAKTWADLAYAARGAN